MASSVWSRSSRKEKAKAMRKVEKELVWILNDRLVTQIQTLDQEKGLPWSAFDQRNHEVVIRVKGTSEICMTRPALATPAEFAPCTKCKISSCKMLCSRPGATTPS